MKLRWTLSFSLCRIHSMSIPPRSKDSQPSAFWRIPRKYSHSKGLKRSSFWACSRASKRFSGKSWKLRMRSNWSLFTRRHPNWDICKVKKDFVCFETVRPVFGKIEVNRTKIGRTRFIHKAQKEPSFPPSRHEFLTLSYQKMKKARAIHRCFWPSRITSFWWYFANLPTDKHESRIQAGISILEFQNLNGSTNLMNIWLGKPCGKLNCLVGKTSRRGLII